MSKNNDRAPFCATGKSRDSCASISLIVCLSAALAGLIITKIIKKVNHSLSCTSEAQQVHMILQQTIIMSRRKMFQQVSSGKSCFLFPLM